MYLVQFKSVGKTFIFGRETYRSRTWAYKYCSVLLLRLVYVVIIIIIIIMTIIIITTIKGSP